MLLTAASCGAGSQVARALAVVAGIEDVEVCPERERELGVVRLRVHDVPWDVAADRVAAATRTQLDASEGRLVFVCGSVSGQGYGAGAGRGLRGGGTSGPTFRFTQTELS